MKKIMISKLFLSIILLTLILGCATTSGVKEASPGKDLAVITDIQIKENSLVITSNKQFTYTTYSSSDPFKTTVEIPDMTTGPFDKKIASDKPGITEIIPQQMDTPKTAVKIDIILESPSTVVPVYKENTLILMVKSEEPFVEAEEPVAETKEPDVETEVPVVVSDIQETAVNMPVSGGNVASMPEATEITSIELKRSDDALKVLITGDGTMMPNVFPLDERIVVDIPDVSLNAQIPESTISPLTGIRVGKHSDKIRLVLDLEEKTNFDFASIGNNIEISLVGGEAVAAALPSEAPPDTPGQMMASASECEELG
jgi:hypothetical protein